MTSSEVISAASAAVAGTGKNPATHDRAALTASGSPGNERVTAVVIGLVIAHPPGIP